MEKIKLVAWDVYGTLIASGGGETSDIEELEISKLRPGALEALTLIKSRNVLQVTSSDADNTSVKKSLKERGIDWTDYFDDLYQLTDVPKDHSIILYFYNLEPKNLLVIGNTYNSDIVLAKEHGCQTLYVPETRFRENSLPIQELERLLDGE